MEDEWRTCLGHLHATLLKTANRSLVPMKGWRVDGHGYLWYHGWPQGILNFRATSKPVLSTPTGHIALASSPPSENQLGYRRWVPPCRRHGYSIGKPFPQHLCSFPLAGFPMAVGSNRNTCSKLSTVRAASPRTGTRGALGGRLLDLPILSVHFLSCNEALSAHSSALSWKVASSGKASLTTVGLSWPSVLLHNTYS